MGSIKDIEKVSVYGAQPKEFIVNYNLNRLKKLQISKQEILTALKNYFYKSSLGEVYSDKEYLTLSVFQNNEIQWNIPVKKVNNRIVYLNNLAKVREVEQEARSYYRVNGKNAITFSLYAANKANTIQLSKQVEEKIEQIKKQIPRDYTINQIYNTTEYLSAELSKIYKRSLYTIFILLLFILIVSKSIRYLFVIVLSLSANLGIAFLLYYILGVEIQLYSLAGITISLGLIIDNSIVVIDHIKKQGNSNVFTPILASTLTTIGSLSIVYFLDEKFKVNLIDFTLVIIINLSVSLIVVFLLIPSLLKKMPLKNNLPRFTRVESYFYKVYQKIILFLLRFKKTTILIIILAFGIPLFMLPQKLEKNETLFEKAYNYTIGNDWYQDNLREYVDKYLGGSFRLFNYYVFENAHYGKNEETKLYVTAQMEKGATVHQMNEAFLVIENYLEQFTEIKQYVSNIYGGDYARLEITFKDDYNEGSFPFVLKNRLVRKVLDLGGIDWSVTGVGNGFSNGNSSDESVNFRVKIKGYNYDTLNNWADTLGTQLKEHPRIKKVIIREDFDWAKKKSYEYNFTLNKEYLALYEKSISGIYDELKGMGLSKSADISLIVKGKYTSIRFQSNEANKFDIWNLKNSPIDSLKNSIVLNNLIKIKKVREEESIYKENQEYIRLLEFEYTGAHNFGSKYLNKVLKEFKRKLPIGYKFERPDEKWFLTEGTVSKYSFLLLLVLVIIYFVCAILFESFKQPFIILSVIPISFIGVFLTFYLFDFNFDQGGMSSFVLLSGITVNSSIFIINGFNKLKQEQGTKESIILYIEAFKQKVFPIILTILSTILGFIPFIINGQNEVFWFALGVGTIGGLLFSVLAILFYLPVFSLKKEI